jgi:RNA polymerase subunit RPABC4/transcription elongation factor Spt4
MRELYRLLACEEAPTVTEYHECPVCGVTPARGARCMDCLAKEIVALRAQESASATATGGGA